MKNIASRETRKKLIHVVLLCSFGVVHQVHTTWLFDRLPPVTGPVTFKAVDIEAKISSAVSQISIGMNRRARSPLRQIADTIKGLFDLRLALHDALYGLPEKYNNTLFLQKCCDEIDNMLRQPDVAFSCRYLAQQDKTLQTFFANIQESVLTKMSFEHLIGLKQSLEGKEVSSLGNLAAFIQWVRNGFDPVSMANDSASTAARVTIQTIRDSFQVMTGTPLRFEKRENQIKVLQQIRALLVSPSGAPKTWFETLRSWTQWDHFLKIYCISAGNRNDTPISFVATDAPEKRELPVIKEQADCDTMVDQKIDHKQCAYRPMPFHKYLLHVVVQQAHRHSLSTNIIACITLCAVVGLAIRNYQLIGGKIAATTKNVYECLKSVGARCTVLLHVNKDFTTIA